MERRDFSISIEQRISLTLESDQIRQAWRRSVLDEANAKCKQWEEVNELVQNIIRLLDIQYYYLLVTLFIK